MKITPGMFRYHKYFAYLSAAFVGNSRFAVRKTILSKSDLRIVDTSKTLNAFIQDCPGEEADGFRVLPATEKGDAVCEQTLAKAPDGLTLRLTALCVHLPKLTDTYNTEGEQQRAYADPAGNRYWFDDSLIQDLGTPAQLQQSQVAGFWTTGDVAAFSWAAPVPAECEAALTDALQSAPAPVVDAPVEVVTNAKRKPALKVIDGGKKKVKAVQPANLKKGTAGWKALGAKVRAGKAAGAKAAK